MRFCSLIISIFLPLSALAADGGFVCAAVHPCNPDGSVQAPYDSGECAPRYIKECLSAKANSVIESCEGNRHNIQKQMSTLKKRVKKLERENRSLRRSRR